MGRELRRSQDPGRAGLCRKRQIPHHDEVDQLLRRYDAAGRRAAQKIGRGHEICGKNSEIRR